MWEHRVIKSGYLGIPDDENLISCPPLSRNEPANDMRLCFTVTPSAYGIAIRPRNPHVPSIIRLRLETRQPA